MSKDYKTISASIEKDSELDQQVNEFRSDRDMTNKSESVRALVRAGLKQKGVRGDDGLRKQQEEREQRSRLSQLVWAMIGLLLVSQISLTMMLAYLVVEISV